MVRDLQRLGQTLSGIWSDFRYSARALFRRPGPASALLLTIAFGLGCNITIRGFIGGLTARRSPIANQGRVVSLFLYDPERGAGPLSYADYLSLKSHGGVFQWIGAARITNVVMRVAEQSDIVPVAEVSPELAAVLQIAPGEGVVISYRTWQSVFGGKGHVRGERIRIGAAEATVTGVAPEWVEGVYSDRPVDLWRRLEEESLQEGESGTRNLWLLAGVRPGVSSGKMKDALRAIGSGRAELDAVPYTGMTPEMASGLARIGMLLRVAAGLVFFIACANVISLLLGRAAARSQETSLRVALGASRRRLARAVFADSIVLAAAGGALSALVALWTSEAIPALLFEQDAEVLVLAPDVLSIVLASAAGAGILIVCGLLPLFEIREDQPAAILRRESAGLSRISRAVRAGLVIAQMACCCLLVIGTGFLFGSFRAALQTAAGHRLGQAVLATVQERPAATVDLNYFRDIEQAARSVAGVTDLAWAARLPGSPPAWQSFRIEPQGLPQREIGMDEAPFTASSLRMFSLPPKAGRLFGFQDRTCRAAVVSEEAAANLFGGETVGRAIRDEAGMPIEIIGVVAARRVGSPVVRRRPAIYYDATARPVPPPAGAAWARFTAPVASSLDAVELDANIVSPGYFTGMGFSLIAGKMFGESAGGCRVAVVNQEANDLYFGGHAVGSAVIDGIGRRTAVVGVVRPANLGTFARPVEPGIYFPMTQDSLPRMTLIMGRRIGDRKKLEEVRHTLEAVPGRGPAPLLVRTLETFLSQTALAPLRIAMAITAACAAIAMFLGILGLYGTLKDSALARRRDLTIRIALGARRRHVIAYLLREGGQLAAAGATAGLLGSVVLSRLLPRIAPGSRAPDLWTWIAGPGVLAAAVAIASVLPARRAVMADPLRKLRSGS